MNSVALSGLGLILLYIVLILQKSQKKQKDFLLTAVFIIIGFELLFRYVNKTITNLHYSWLIGLDLFYWVLFGPVMYLYIEFVIREYRKITIKDLRHFIPLPFLLFPYIGFLVADTENFDFFTYINSGNVFYRIIIFIWDYITPVYFIFIVIKLVKHKRNAVNYFSNLKKKDLGWLFYLAGGYLLYIIIAVSLYYLNLITDNAIPDIDLEVSVIPLCIYVFGLGLYGYKQEGVFTEDLVKSGKLSEEKFTEFKYSRSGLSQSESKEIIENLKTLMNTEKPYMDSELTINDLCRQVNTTIHKLSQVINESFNKNFYEYINEYRIKEVANKLKDPTNNNLKIISLAYECGFNSKSAFYSAFKQYTGVTPTEYRKKLQRNHEQIFLN